jgi:hypothetical protein
MRLLWKVILIYLLIIVAVVGVFIILAIAFEIGSSPPNFIVGKYTHQISNDQTQITYTIDVYNAGGDGNGTIGNGTMHLEYQEFLMLPMGASGNNSGYSSSALSKVYTYCDVKDRQIALNHGKTTTFSVTFQRHNLASQQELHWSFSYPKHSSHPP